MGPVKKYRDIFSTVIKKASSTFFGNSRKVGGFLILKFKLQVYIKGFYIIITDKKQIYLIQLYSIIDELHLASWYLIFYYYITIVII